MNQPTQHHYVASVGYDTTVPISTILWSSLPSTSPSHQLLPSPSSPSSSPSTHPLHGVISASAASFDCSFSGCSQGVNPIAIVRNAIVSIQACQGGNSNTSIYTQDALRQRRGRLPHSIRIVCWKCLASSLRRYGMGERWIKWPMERPRNNGCGGGERIQLKLAETRVKYPKNATIKWV